MVWQSASYAVVCGPSSMWSFRVHLNLACWSWDCVRFDWRRECILTKSISFPVSRSLSFCYHTLPGSLSPLLFLSACRSVLPWRIATWYRCQWQTHKRSASRFYLSVVGYCMQRGPMTYCDDGLCACVCVCVRACVCVCVCLLCVSARMFGCACSRR